MEVMLFEPPEPPPPEAPEPPPPPPRPSVARSRVPQVNAEPAAPTPAQAAEVVAQEAPPDEPLDLTAFSITTGTATTYAGGKTASSGTSSRAVTGAVSAEGVPNETGTGSSDLSRPVKLVADEWDCPWPAEADSLGIDEQTVVIRVTVRADGQFESAEIVRDPGHGFGAETLKCAPLNRYQPALDRTGRPVKARSGPIRVRFTR